MKRHLLSVICLFTFTAFAAHADDTREPFDVPLPRAAAMPIVTAPNLPRPGTREIWQYYGVDKRGRWVPRVILSPSGAYYYYNGAPYRYTTSQPSLFMPYIVD